MGLNSVVGPQIPGRASHSKWIVETENNLGALFDAAEAGQVLLCSTSAVLLDGQGRRSLAYFERTTRPTITSSVCQTATSKRLKLAPNASWTEI